MAYSTHNFQSGATITASSLNQMDAQIKSNDERITQFVNNGVPTESDVEQVATNVINANMSQMTGGISDVGKRTLCDFLGVSGRTEYIDFNTSTELVTIPRDVVLFHKGSSMAKNTTDSVTIDTSSFTTSALRLFYDTVTDTWGCEAYNTVPTDSKVYFAGLRKFKSSSTSKYWASFTTPFPWSVNGNPYSICMNYRFATMLPSPKSYINYDSAKGTLYIPHDILIFDKDIGGIGTNYISVGNGTDQGGFTIADLTYAKQSTTAIIVYWDNNSKTIGTQKYTTTVRSHQYVICMIRLSLNGSVVSISSPLPWSIDGHPYGIVPDKTTRARAFVKGVNHRGYSNVAPENTLAAFMLSSENGFRYVETDVAFSSDNIPVLLHDGTIDRTSNGTGAVGNFTLEQLKSYDFGSWKSSAYTGEQIPTLEEFFALCKNKGLHPYVELKNSATYTEAQIQSCVAIAKKYGMLRDCTWISFNDTYLRYVKNADAKARLGFLIGTVSETAITKVKALRNDVNEVFMDFSTCSAAMYERCIAEDIPMEIYTIDSVATIKSMNPYITGVTSNSVDASIVLTE